MPTEQPTEPTFDTVEATRTAVVRGGIAHAEIRSFFDKSFGALPAAVAAQGATIVGPAFARYHSVSDEFFDLEVGFPVDRAITPSGDIVPGDLPAGRIAHLIHYGGYDGLGAAWDRLRSWIIDQGHTPGPASWEIYRTEPTPDMNPDDNRTDLIWTVLSTP